MGALPQGNRVGSRKVTFFDDEHERAIVFDCVFNEEWTPIAGFVYSYKYYKVDKHRRPAQAHALVWNIQPALVVRPGYGIDGITLGFNKDWQRQPTAPIGYRTFELAEVPNDEVPELKTGAIEKLGEKTIWNDNVARDHNIEWLFFPTKSSQQVLLKRENARKKAEELM